MRKAQIYIKILKNRTNYAELGGCRQSIGGWGGVFRGGVKISLPNYSMGKSI